MDTKRHFDKMAYAVLDAMPSDFHHLYRDEIPYIKNRIAGLLRRFDSDEDTYAAAINAILEKDDCGGPTCAGCGNHIPDCGCYDCLEGL